MPRCVDCGTETPREEMYGAPDELRCRACVQKRFPTTNVPAPHAPTVFRRRPPVTLFVIIAAVVATVLYASQVRAVRWLFADDFDVWRGQLWRLLTAVFLHDRKSPLHILFNALWLWRLGKPVESWMGSLRYAGFFIVAGAGPMAAQFLTGGSPIGLSGVVYALVGLLVALRREEDFAAEVMPPSVSRFFLLWFFIAIGLTYAGWLPVANVAHGSGAVIGWLFGRAILSRRRRLAVAGACLVCAALALATLYMPWDWRYDFFRGTQSYAAGDYQQALTWFERAERRHPDATLEKFVDTVRDEVKRKQEGGP